MKTFAIDDLDGEEGVDVEGALRERFHNDLRGECLRLRARLAHADGSGVALGPSGRKPESFGLLREYVEAVEFYLQCVDRGGVHGGQRGTGGGPEDEADFVPPYADDEADRSEGF
jgi:hypothetical protein